MLQTANQPLPLASNLRPPVLDLDAFPLGKYLEAATPKKLDESVAPREDTKAREIKNEAGVM
jgi:hypothetical protein